jgi:hypothetical protein
MMASRRSRLCSPPVVRKYCVADRAFTKVAAENLAAASRAARTAAVGPAVCRDDIVAVDHHAVDAERPITSHHRAFDRLTPRKPDRPRRTTAIRITRQRRNARRIAADQKQRSVDLVMRYSNDRTPVNASFIFSVPDPYA